MNRLVNLDLIPSDPRPKTAVHAGVIPASEHLLGIAEDVIVCLSLVAMILLGLVVADIALGGAEAASPVVAEVAAPGR